MTSSNVGSFWLKDYFNHLNKFKQLTACKIHSGDASLLWNDHWHDDTLQDKFSQLHYFAKNEDIIFVCAKKYSR